METLKDRQAKLAILSLQLESLQIQYNQLKQQVVLEMNNPKEDKKS